jgi:hypothetical protein
MTSHRYCTITLGVSLLAMTACTTGNQPQWMPRGYTHQGDNTPISSPQPSSPWSNSAVIHDTDAMGESTAAWQGAVFELLEKLGSHLPQDGTPLLLVANAPHTPQDLALDHYLRQALMQKGINLTNVAGNSLIVGFDAVSLNTSNLKTAKMKAGYEVVSGASLEGLYLLSAAIKTLDGKTTLGEAYTVAVLPYEKGKSSLSSHASAREGNSPTGFNP